MRQVKLKVSDLLEKVRQNREKHIADYKEACDGYKEQALRRIDEITSELRDRIGRLKEGKVIDLMAISFGLDAPRSYEREYDQAIAMLEMSVETEVILDAEMFKQYVMDDWKWKQDFQTQTMNYSRGR